MSSAQFRQTLVLAPAAGEKALSVLDDEKVEHLAVDANGDARLESRGVPPPGYVRVRDGGAVEIAGGPLALASAAGADISIVSGAAGAVNIVSGAAGAVNITSGAGGDVNIAAGAGGQVNIAGLSVNGVYAGAVALPNDGSPAPVGLGPAAGAGTLQVACAPGPAAVFFVARGGGAALATRALSLPVGDVELLASWAGAALTLRFSAPVGDGTGTTHANVVFACAGGV